MAVRAPLNLTLADRFAKVVAKFEPSDIAAMELPEQLLAVQAALGYGSEWGVWEIPLEVATPGSRDKGSRTVRLSSGLPDHISPDDHEASVIWTQILRVGLLRTIIPVQPRAAAAPGTIRSLMRAAAQVTRVVASKPGPGFWSRLTIQEAADALNRSSLEMLRSFLSRLHRRGLIADCLKMPPRTKGVAAERNRLGAAAPKAHPKIERKFQPLPDEFVSQCGWRVLWLVQNLGPTLLSAIEEASKVSSIRSWREAKGITDAGSSIPLLFLLSDRDDAIQDWHWTAPNGDPIASLPFQLVLRRRLGASRRKSTPFIWPPKTFSEAMILLNLLQTTHGWILFLLAGPRSSEVLSYDENCVVEVPTTDEHRIEGRTYKLVRDNQGRKRDFPAPKIALFAARQQIRLARVVKRLANAADPDSLGKHLWVLIYPRGVGKRGAPMDDWNKSLNVLAKVLALQNLLDSGNPTVHTQRFRKTLARLVALTMVNATMILMDCFGHDDPETTLISYILSDKRVHADVIRIQKELVVLLAVDAIKQAETLGGVGGEHVRRKVAERLLVLKKEKLGPQDMYELAEDMTLQGRMWAIVTPGILCTLPQGSAGPCSKKQGGRDTANCRPGCSYQVLSEFNKVECDENVAHILPLLERAIGEENEIMISYFRGQLCNSLYRWKEVFQKWADHPVVAAGIGSWLHQSGELT